MIVATLGSSIFPIRDLYPKRIINSQKVVPPVMLFTDRGQWAGQKPYSHN